MNLSKAVRAILPNHRERHLWSVSRGLLVRIGRNDPDEPLKLFVQYSLVWHPALADLLADDWEPVAAAVRFDDAVPA